MDRREFLESSGRLLASVALARTPMAETLSLASEVRPSAGRLVLPLNQHWRFSPQAVDGFQARAFDDSGFDEVSLPHCNRQLPWHGFDEKSYQFISSYRRRFRLPAEARGQHVFVDFEGVMTASTVWINGHLLGQYKGGYTPFSFELTADLDWEGENVLAVSVDSSERADIPPFGDLIDYLTFGGIYRQVWLRAVPAAFIENIFARPQDVLSPHPKLEVECFTVTLDENQPPWTMEVELHDGDKIVARAAKSIPKAEISSEPASHVLRLEGLENIRLWDLEQPNLYTVLVRMRRGGQVIDEDRRRTGFRQASFTEEGFKLNGRLVKLRGLNRHQTFPFVGAAMPRRVERRDAMILKQELKCNIIRTSHYPQSRHFLDACDEIGLLVLEEIPGWQHIGDQDWKSLAVDNVRRMIRRDWNHPSIVLWGVRINESADDHAFYTRTNTLAHALDPSRQTGGIRDFQESEFLEDVFTMNDFGFPLKAPNHPRYLNTEFVGHTFDTKSIDNNGRLTEHTLRHARIHNQIAGNPQSAGGIGWCAFDYNTHADFGSGDRICYHGVSDIFRLPKPAAGFYQSQCEPEEEIVLEPAFHWSASDEYLWYEKVVVCSNCEHLKFFVGDKLVTEADPNRAEFGNLRHPPFFTDLSPVEDWTADLRIEGYIGNKKVVAKSYSGKAIDQRFELRADDDSLIADGADATRVVFRVTDEYGRVRPYATAAIAVELEGPAELIGDNPFALVGGVGAVWIRAKEQPGSVRLRAKHPTLGRKELEIQVGAAEIESA